MEMQRLLDGSIVPVGPHRLDETVCSDGSILIRQDVWFDAKGGAHSNEEDYCAANNDIVHEVVNAYHAAEIDYASHDDVAGNYFQMAWELFVANRGRKAIVEWLREHGLERHPDCIVEAVATVIWDTIDSSDVTEERCHSKYAGYSGDDLFVASVDDGECEFEIDIAGHPLLSRIPENELNAACVAYRGDAYLHEHSVWNSETERRDSLGYIRNGVISGIASPGGKWHFFIPMDRIKDIIRDYFTDLADCELC